MKFNSVDNIVPAKGYAVAEIQDAIQEDASGLVVAVDEGNGEEHSKNAILYVGKIKSISGKETDVIERDDIALFNRFAGNHIVTGKGFNKILDVEDILATVKDPSKITADTVRPSRSRVLVKMFKTNVDEDGLYLSEDASQDPNLAAIAFGVVVSTGNTCVEGYEANDIVGWQPYAGEAIAYNPEEGIAELRVIREDDIIMTA